MFSSKILSSLFIVFFAFATSIQAQVSTISLEQTPGEFTIKSLTLSPGDYQFEIANSGVDHEIGFVVAPKGKTDEPNHIKEAYVQALVATGTTQKTKVVSLTAGEYVYFCPLNPTEQYALTVK